MLYIYVYKLCSVYNSVYAVKHCLCFFTTCYFNIMYCTIIHVLIIFTVSIIKVHVSFYCMLCSIAVSINFSCFIILNTILQQ